MTTFSASYRGAAGSDTLPFAGLRSGTSTNSPILREIKCFSVGTAAARIRIVRLTTAGTATAITVNEMFEAQVAAEATPVHTYTSTAPTIQTGDIDICAVGAATASGFHYVYYFNPGLIIPPGATNANGIGLVEHADTANTYDGTFIWEE
jgi:hypothetical protein